MFPSSWTLSLAVLAALLACCASQVSAQSNDDLPADYTDAFIEGAKIIWALASDKPVGFERTHKALRGMLERMDEMKGVDGEEENEFVATKRKEISAFLNACATNEAERAYKCMVVFSNIDELLKEANEASSMRVNTVPYLEECKRRQESFCAEPSKKHKSKSATIKKVLHSFLPKSSKDNGARKQ